MKLKWLAVICLGLAAVIWACCHFSGNDVSDEDGGKDRRRVRIERKAKRTGVSAKEAVREVIEGKVPHSKKTLRRKVGPVSDRLFDHLGKADQKLAQRVQDALDETDFAGVAAAAEQSARSGNPEVRQNAVEALGWFGAEALPELLTFLTDKDEDVMSSAVDHCQSALSMIEDDNTRIATAEVLLKTVINTELLTVVVDEITRQDDDLKVMQSLVDIIDSGNAAGVRIAKEEYETLTGEEWTGVDAAEAWLQENYEPPEGESDDVE